VTALLLFDECLSPRLPLALADVFPSGIHAAELGLQGGADTAIYRAALETGRTIVTRDSDFIALALARRAPPPKIIVLRGPNATRREIEVRMRSRQDEIATFHEDLSQAVLLLV
jgi:predicted nuclease of predicted toxin-antitoxin system